MHNGEDRSRVEVRVRIRRWNMEENLMSLSLSLSLRDMWFFSLSSLSCRLSFHTLFLSPDDYFQSVVANKLSY